MMKKKKPELATQNILPRDGPTNRLFKVPLTCVLEREKAEIPRIVMECVKCLEKGVKTPMIFSDLGWPARVAQIRASFEQNSLFSLQNCSDYNEVSGVLKQYLSNLPEPLFTWRKYIAVTCTSTIPEERLAVHIKEVLSAIHPNHVKLLAFLVKFLSFVAKTEENGVNASALGRLVGPAFLPPRDGKSFASDSLGIATFTTFLINNHLTLFGEYYSSSLIAPSTTSASSPSTSLRLPLTIRENKQPPLPTLVSPRPRPTQQQKSNDVQTEESKQQQKEHREPTPTVKHHKAHKIKRPKTSPASAKEQDESLHDNQQSEEKATQPNPQQQQQQQQGEEEKQSVLPVPPKPPETGEVQGPPVKIVKMKALYSFQARCSTELSLSVGQIVTIIRTDPSGWFDGMSENGGRGFFPSNYCETIEVEKIKSLSVKQDCIKPSIKTLQERCFRSSSPSSIPTSPSPLSQQQTVMKPTSPQRPRSTLEHFTRSKGPKRRPISKRMSAHLINQMDSMQERNQSEPNEENDTGDKEEDCQQQSECHSARSDLSTTETTWKSDSGPGELQAISKYLFKIAETINNNDLSSTLKIASSRLSGRAEEWIALVQKSQSDENPINSLEALRLEYDKLKIREEETEEALSIERRNRLLLEEKLRLSEANVGSSLRESGFRESQHQQFQLPKEKTPRKVAAEPSSIKIIVRLKKSTIDESTVFVEGNTINSNGNSFTCDKVFGVSDSPESVFNFFKPSIDFAMSGKIASMIASGCFGSGKTHLLFGTPSSIVDAGIVQRTVEYLFSQEWPSPLNIEMGLLEWHANKLNDLLLPKGCPQQQLTVRRERGIIKLGNLTVKAINSTNEAFPIIEIARNASKSEQSAESHLILFLWLSLQSSSGDIDGIHGKLSFIDLASIPIPVPDTNDSSASSQQSKSKQIVTTSLGALRDVIHAVRAGDPQPPFTKSKLTQILSDSFNTNSQTLLVGTLPTDSQKACTTTIDFLRSSS